MEYKIWQTTLKTPTWYGWEIAATGLELLKRRYDFRMRPPIRKIELKIANLSRPSGVEQMTLFDDNQAQLRREKLEETIEQLDRRFGHGSVIPAKYMMYPELSAYNPADNPHPFG